MKLPTPTLQALLCSSLLLAGCDLTVPYVTSVPVPEQGTAKLAVATVDERPDVLDKQHPPTYVGTMRGRVGIPLDRLTHDGRPLADDFSSSIVASLDAAGFQAAAVSVSPAADGRAALRSLGQAAASRWILLEIREWKSDTYTDSTVSYDVTLHVYDATGQELAAQPDAGSEDIAGGSFFNPIHRSDDQLRQFYESKLKAWFSDPRIEAALRQ